MKIRFASTLAVLALIAGCGNVDYVPPAPADAAVDAQPDAAPADSAPRMMCGDGVCAGPDDCARDCPPAPPADAGPQCGTGAVVCPGTTGCTDLRTDSMNCGGCGTRCATGQTCGAGVCTNPSPTCGGANLQTDSNNCGTCGTRCASGQICNAGVCAAAPATCGGADLRIDAANCGTCGNRCGASQVCVAGSCTTPMSMGMMPTTGGIETWEVTFETAAGDGAISIDGWIMQPIWTHCTQNRTPTALALSVTCTFRFIPDSSRLPWFNAFFSLPPIPATGTETRGTWAVFMRRMGAPAESYGSVRARRNGVPVELQPALNGMRDGYNWVPVVR